MFNFLKSNKDETQPEVTTSTAQSLTDIRAQWKALAADRKVTREDIAALCIYRSMRKGEGKEGAISRLRKSFKPISNLVKLENGAYPYGALDSALWLAKNSTLVSWPTEDERKELLSIAKEIKIKGKEIQ